MYLLSVLSAGFMGKLLRLPSPREAPDDEQQAHFWNEERK
jgi:hypothetical protein